MKNRKSKLSLRKGRKADKENMPARKKKVSAEQFVEGTLARMMGNDDKRR
jgi:hypothetical protein